MKIYLPHNHYNEKHLETVIAEMKKIGIPEIKVTAVCDDEYQAIEGSHRLRACEILNIEPIIIIIDDSTSIEDAEIDFDGCAETVGDISNIEGEYIEF